MKGNHGAVLLNCPGNSQGTAIRENIWLMAGSFYLSGIQRPAAPLKEIGLRGSGPMTILFPQIPASFGSGSRITNMSGIVAILV